MQRINRVLKALFAFPFTWGVLAALLVAEWGFLWWFEPPLPMTLLVVVLGMVLLVMWPVLFLRSEMFQRLYSQMPYETEIDNLEEILASCPEAFKAPALHTVTLVDQVRPKLVMLGKSLFLFPEPVQAIAECCRSFGIPVLFDGAHVLGLILGGQFQNPFAEGAHFINASTHKTFPGPQRGVILGNLKSDKELKWWQSIDRGVMPGSSSSHHLHTLPGLVIAIREAKAHGAAYAQQIVANAKAFGRALMDEGVQVEAEDFGFTESHQLAINVSNFGLGKDIARSLADNDIILNYNMLPGDTDARNPSGLRIGVQEMTRYGMKEDEMGELASLVKAVISGGSAKDEVNRLRSRFTEVLFV